MNSNLHCLLDEISTFLSKPLFEQFFLNKKNCFFIYKLLDLTSQGIICRFLWLADGIPFSFTKSWSSNMEQLFASLGLLKRMGLLIGRDNVIFLHSTFKLGLEAFFTEPSEPPEGRDSFVSSGAEQNERFQNILYFLVNPSGKSFTTDTQSTAHFLKPSTSIINLLVSNGLVNKSDSLSITSKGFQFVLMDRCSQLWQLLTEYLRQFQKDQSAYLSTLQQFVELSFSGSKVPLKIPHEHQQLFSIAVELGICNYSSTEKTHVVTSPSSSLFEHARGLEKKQEERFIVIETNYKLYAYTNNPLHASLLSLFCYIRGTFPNLIYAILSGDKVKESIAKGITADQILDYLDNHIKFKNEKTDDSTVISGAESTRNSSTIPPTVRDQIKLWELEKFRLKWQDVVCYSDFNTASQFQSAITYAESIDALILVNQQKKLLIVQSQCHEQMKMFFKTNK